MKRQIAIAAAVAAVCGTATAQSNDELKARLQRINPVESADEYRRLFADVLALEQYRRQLREYLVGDA